MASSETTQGSSGKKPSRLVMIIAALAGVGLLLVICLGVGLYFVVGRIEQNVGALTKAVTQLADQPVHNQIAFVGNDGNLWLVSPQGDQLHQITSDGKGYHFPTWSPDDRRLAFIGPNGQAETALYVTSAAQSAPTLLFDQPGSAPFYLYWSPDSNTLSFLTQDGSDLSMRQVSVDRPGSDRVMEVGSPFYWVWSPSGEKLLLHVGGSRAASAEAHISLLDNRTGAQRVDLDLAPGQFQAPFWSADGQYFYYIAADDQEQNAIYKTKADTLAQTLITKLQNFTYLTVSPDNKYLAYVQLEPNTHPPFGIAYLVGTDGSQQRQLLDNPAGSLYWSPDGSKLAVLVLTRRDDGSTAKVGGMAAPLPQEVVLRWLVYNVATEEFKTLISFSPTVDFLQTVPYFDQYHLSLTFWSPDSRYFVITKEENSKTGAGSVWVLDTTGAAGSLKVGDGTLAVWSWK